MIALCGMARWDLERAALAVQAAIMLRNHGYQAAKRDALRMARFYVNGAIFFQARAEARR